MKLRQLDDCDKKYYITANTIHPLVQRFLFEGLEIVGKILNFVFLKLQLDGKKLVFKAKTSLAEVSAYSDFHRMECKGFCDFSQCLMSKIDYILP